MKKHRNHSDRASALQVSISVALISILAALLASGFRAAPVTDGGENTIVTAVAGVNQGVPNEGLAPLSVPLASPSQAPSPTPQPIPTPAPPQFYSTGSLNTGRFEHTATLLSN